jgi:hypothetical protein
MIIEIMERYYKHYYSSNETTNRTTQNHYYLNIAGATSISGYAFGEIKSSMY